MKTKVNDINFLRDITYKAQQDGVQKIVVGGVVYNKRGEILILTRKMDDFMGGIDELPSGNIEHGENIYDGLLREVKEETGMNIKRIQNYINSFDYQSHSGKHVRQFNFSIAANSENITLTEHTAYKWQTIKQILDNPNITAEVKQCIKVYALDNQIKKLKKSILGGNKLEIQLNK